MDALRSAFMVTVASYLIFPSLYLPKHLYVCIPWKRKDTVLKLFKMNGFKLVIVFSIDLTTVSYNTVQKSCVTTHSFKFHL